MTTQATAFPVNDRECYPLHEEDEVSETEFHDLQTDYLCDALRAFFPEQRVFRNVGIYWVPGVTSLYRAPDLFVVMGTIAEPTLRVYHTWQDPPISFVVEVGSRSTFREDEGPKVDVYSRDIQAAEYLYTNPPQGDMRLWRMGASGEYEPVAREANGRLRSEQLGLEFGIEEGFLRIYTPEGERLRSHLESERDREEAEVRAASEARQREEAEARAARAEARAAEERARREEMERRLRELEAEREPPGDGGEGPSR